MYKEGEVGATFGREHSTTLENFAHKCAPTTYELQAVSLMLNICRGKRDVHI